MFNVKVETGPLVRAMAGLERQLPYVTARALTKTAKAVEDAIRTEMASRFDRPTPYTLNALRTKPATKQDPVAYVWFREFASKGTPATKYLLPQVTGGDRPVKRFERALRHAGILPPGMFAVPGSGAKLDAYGNMSRGQIVQILSALRANPDATQNRTKSRRSRRNARRAQYFVGQPGGAPLGVWQRISFAHGSAVRPVLIFTRAPIYRKRLPFFERASEVAHAEYPRQFRLALHEALRTVRRR